MSDPWDRQELESAKAYAAFCAYRDQGVEFRSLRNLAVTLGKPFNLMKRWSGEWNWVARCRAYDTYLELRSRKDREKQHSKDLAEFAKRRKAAAQALQGASINLLLKVSKRIEQMSEKDITPDNVARLLRATAVALEKGTEAEAESLGVHELIDVLDANEISNEVQEADSETDS